MSLPFLIIAAAAACIIVLAAVIMLVIIYGHPDDANVAWFPRITVIFGLWLALMSILVLPYDVSANQSGMNSGVRVDIIWEIVYIALAILLVGVIPFAFFYYESEVDDTEPSEGFLETQLGGALKYTTIFLIIVIILFVILYTYINIAKIPVRRVAQSNGLVYDMNLPISSYDNVAAISRSGQQSFPCVRGCLISNFIWEIPVSFPIYIIAIIAFGGWFFFTIFVGVGLFALPLDLINGFRTRPTPISTKVYFEERQKLGERAKALLELGKKLQGQFDEGAKGILGRSKERSDLNAFEQHYFYLKKDYQLLYVAHKLKGGNPLIYFGMLIGGLIGIALSCAWYIHIAIFILPNPPYSPFLNTFFLDLQLPSFPLFGVLAFAIFSFYLLWCVVKGNFSVGVRFLLFKIYPMEVGNTYMNAFLFNTFFILLCSVPTVQFCIIAFPIYAAYTDANVMFGNQIKYLEFFSYFYANNVFVIALIIVSTIAIVISMTFPKNQAAAVERQLDELAKSTNTSLHDYADPK